MKNIFNLMKPIELYLSHSDYDGSKDHLSTTQTLKPIREIIIGRNFREQLLKLTDISFMIPFRIGDAGHFAIEKVLREKYPEGIIEERIYWDIDWVTMSGKPDLLMPKKDIPSLNCPTCNNKVGVDWKFSKTWTAGNIEKVIGKYRKQLSINRYGLYRNDITLDDTGMIVIICLDWNSWTARKFGLEGCAIQEIPVDLEPINETEEWLYKRVEEIKPYWDCKNILELPPCSNEERAEFGGKKCKQYCGARFLCPDGVV